MIFIRLKLFVRNFNIAAIDQQNKKPFVIITSITETRQKFARALIAKQMSMIVVGLTVTQYFENILVFKKFIGPIQTNVYFLFCIKGHKSIFIKKKIS